MTFAMKPIFDRTTFTTETVTEKLEQVAVEIYGFEYRQNSKID